MRVIRLLKDDTYQLIYEALDGSGYEEVVYQGTLQEIEAFVSLEERGLL